MVPAQGVVLEEIPLTTDAKVDRDALPPPLDAVVGPHNAIEELVAEIWYAVLDLPDLL